MIESLSVRNLAIVEQLDLEFTLGLNMLSGETGAGKSIIVNALGLILGKRAGVHLVRTGADGASVQAVFVLAPDSPARAILTREQLPMEDRLVIRRQIPARGAGRAFVNERPVKVGLLRELAPYLVEYAGQHEQRVLMESDLHRELLDRFAGAQPLLEQVQGAWRELGARQRELNRLLRDADRVVEQQEYLRFQLQELQGLALTLGEEDAIEGELKLLQHASELRDGCVRAERELYSSEGAAVERLSRAEGLLQGLARVDPRFGAQAELLGELMFQVEELAHELRAGTSGISSDPGRLDELEQRRAEIHRLKRKHRCEADELVERQQVLEQELDQLANLDERIAIARDELDQARLRAAEHAAVLTKAREQAAQRLDMALDAELAELAMPQARFRTVVQPLGEGLDLGGGRRMGAQGADQVDFHLSANPGEEPRPIAKVASGGELSRVLLALKLALRGHGRARSFIFDEIDTGIGGETAEVVGAKLAQLAGEGQLLCISHLPQIASLADAHFVVAKQVRDGRTRSQARRLDLEGRVQELARMIGGSAVTEASRAYARELLQAYARAA